MMREGKRLYRLHRLRLLRDVGTCWSNRLAHQDILAGTVKVQIPGAR